jgi:penicillin amidase
MKRFLAGVGFVLAAVLVVLLAFVTNVALGMRAASPTSGNVTGLALKAPVQILRDVRGVPHIRAENEHDLFFAQGYVEGQDRLFQLDLVRRFVDGELSEVLGKPALTADEASRTVPVRALVAKQYERLTPQERDLLQAFADGVNSAMTREPLPVEFRVLMYHPKPWQAQDSLAVGFATVLDLTDTWNDIETRVAKKTLPLTDPCYDAPVTTGLTRIADPNHCSSHVALAEELRDTREPIGSNEWAAGASHTTTGRALLASDPHLRLGIPGVWYLIDLQAPGFHAAGGTLAGTPGVILGHNDRIAWGATNGTVVALSAFEAPAKLDERAWQTETFHVRFGGDVTKRYYRTRDVFGATVGKDQRLVLVRWNAFRDPVSPLPTFALLDRARSIDEAVAALRKYPGPTQNFALADTSGRAAYYLAGDIPNDPLWARGFHPSTDLSKLYPSIAFDGLPHVAASRDAIVWTANNKMYSDGYPHQLTAQFEPPYRAHRIAELLRARSRYDVEYFRAMQMDTLSLPERELAHIVASSIANTTDDAEIQAALSELKKWDGEFTPDSRGASIASALRRELVPSLSDMTAALIGARSGRDSALARELRTALRDQQFHANEPWRTAGEVIVKHPLASLGLSFLNGTTFAGNGDAYTVHVQNYGHSQSFRAVWDVGNWDAGGMLIPQGESGQPGSPHYTDQAQDWIAGRLPSLPYTTTAVERATVERMSLLP